MKKLSLLLLLSAALGTALAQSQPNYHDTVNCRWTDGRVMADSDCAFFRKLKADDEANATAAQAKRNARLEELQRQAAALEKAKADRKAIEDVKNLESKRELEARDAEALKARENLEKQVALEEASQKKRCGKDFGKLRVGMTLDRYEECNEPLEFVTETVSKGAVVETYRGMFWYIHANANDGKIVAFTRR